MSPSVPPGPARIEETGVLLRLRVKVPAERREAFLDFCRRAFPVYESVGGARMALYEDRAEPGRFEELGFYRGPEDYRRAEAALESDPGQAALLKEWRGLLEGPPEVVVLERVAFGNRA